jgi:hypothetical protein
MDSFLFSNKENLTLECIKDLIDEIVHAGIYMQYKNQCVQSVKLAISENIPETVCSIIYINITHVQAAFCTLLLGYALAVVCMVKDITWYHLVSIGRV